MLISLIAFSENGFIGEVSEFTKKHERRGAVMYSFDCIMLAAKSATDRVGTMYPA
jgi:hypothetical protein